MVMKAVLRYYVIDRKLSARLYMVLSVSHLLSNFQKMIRSLRMYLDVYIFFFLIPLFDKVNKSSHYDGR